MDESTLIIAFVLSLAVLIVFFIMAARLKKVMEYTNQAGYGFKARQFFEARSLELVGEKKEALKNYYQLLWRYDVRLEQQGITKDKLKDKIKELGGDPETDYKDISK